MAGCVGLEFTIFSPALDSDVSIARTLVSCFVGALTKDRDPRSVTSP